MVSIGGKGGNTERLSADNFNKSSELSENKGRRKLGVTIDNWYELHHPTWPVSISPSDIASLPATNVVGHMFSILSVCVYLSSSVLCASITKNYNFVPSKEVICLTGKVTAAWWKVTAAYHRVYD